MRRVRDRKRAIEFETDTMVHGRAVVVRAAPKFAMVRLKGTRTRFTVPWEAVYHVAAKLWARSRTYLEVV